MGSEQEPKCDLAMNALAKALVSRATESLGDLIHHSDQGVQYASNDYIDGLKAHSIQISMSRKGNPYDNAFAESFVKKMCTTKKDCIQPWAINLLFSSKWRLP